jgi:hypothetical protein
MTQSSLHCKKSPLVTAPQNYNFVIWKNCPYFTPAMNRRFRLGRTSETPNGRLKEVFDADHRRWVPATGNYVYQRAAKLKEIMGAQI